MNAILDARSVNRSDAIPAAMLISVGIVEGVFALILKSTQTSQNWPKPRRKTAMAKFSPGRGC